MPRRKQKNNKQERRDVVMTVMLTLREWQQIENRAHAYNKTKGRVIVEALKEAGVLSDDE